MACYDGATETYPHVVLLVVERDVVARTNTVVWAFAYRSLPYGSFYVGSLSFAGSPGK